MSIGHGPGPRAVELSGQIERSMRLFADKEVGRRLSEAIRRRHAFMGLLAPVRRRQLWAVDGLDVLDARDALDLARKMWIRPWREMQLCAVDVLARAAPRMSAKDIPALIDLARQRSWCDTVDGLASVASQILLAERMGVMAGRVNGPGPGRLLMDAALRDQNQWARRLAVIHQNSWGARADVEWVKAAVAALGEDKEFFASKGAGWALRELGRHHPEEVKAFLASPQAALSESIRAEAAKGFDDGERRASEAASLGVQDRRGASFYSMDAKPVDDDSGPEPIAGPALSG